MNHPLLVSTTCITIVNCGAPKGVAEILWAETTHMVYIYRKRPGRTHTSVTVLVPRVRWRGDKESKWTLSLLVCFNLLQKECSH